MVSIEVQDPIFGPVGLLYMFSKRYLGFLKIFTFWVFLGGSKVKNDHFWKFTPLFRKYSISHRLGRFLDPNRSFCCHDITFYDILLKPTFPWLDLDFLVNFFWKSGKILPFQGYLAYFFKTLKWVVLQNCWVSEPQIRSSCCIL